MTESKRKEQGVSRRAVLAGGAGMLAAAGAMGALGRNSEPASSGKPAQEDWGHEADIVVVGGGSAGLTAAVIAASKGNKVILVEKAPLVGGTTAKSGGVAWIPNNMILKAKGVEDPRDDCLRYMARYSYPQRYDSSSPTLGLEESEYKLLETFYDNGNKALEELKSTGAINFGEFSVGDGVGPPPDYADHLPENKVPRGRAVVHARWKTVCWTCRGRFLFD